MIECSCKEIGPGNNECVPALPSKVLKEDFVHHNGNEMLCFPGGKWHSILAIPVPEIVQATS
jgi:hypothetical protein